MTPIQLPEGVELQVPVSELGQQQTVDFLVSECAYTKEQAELVVYGTQKT